MKRRDFLKYGGAGIAATTATAGPLAPIANAACQSASGTDATIQLRIDNKRIMMVDGKFFDFLAFQRTGSGSSSAFTVPGPVLRVVEGDQVTIRVRNDRPEAHGFNITGIAEATIPVIPPDATASVTFTAPNAGSYIYYDGSHAPTEGLLYRVLGLHGALIVHPRDGGRTANGSPTPFSTCDHNPALIALFDAFGTDARFPGNKWVPAGLENDFTNFEKIWLFSQVDPAFNSLIPSNGNSPVDQNKPIVASRAAMINAFTPRYFTINGRSGFDLADGSDIIAANYIGEPTLIRCMNAGLCHHAAHIHGNHLMELSEADVTTGIQKVRDNILERDVWQCWPMQRRDMLLPFELPPDIPFRDNSGPLTLAQAVVQEPFPLRYVMHCHCEMSQTAAGGNYPQGCVTHWQIEGGLGGRSRPA